MLRVWNINRRDIPPAALIPITRRFIMENTTLHILDEGMSPQEIAAATVCCKLGPKIVTTTEGN